MGRLAGRLIKRKVQNEREKMKLKKKTIGGKQIRVEIKRL